MSKSKDKGTWAESAVAYYLQCNGWPAAERRALRGGKDWGDIAGTPGVCWEVKYVGKGQGIQMKPWMAELTTEMDNSRSPVGVLVMKTAKYGSMNTGSWYACMPAPTHDYVWTMAVKNGLVMDLPVPPSLGLAVASRVQSEKNMAAVRLSSAALAHVTTFSPGYAYVPQTHYRTMLLRDAVTLIRCAGWGDPQEAGS
jgi:hypothetical protein